MMFAVDEDYGDEITSGLDEDVRREADEDAERQRWEDEHPEERCPPRE